MSWTRLSHRGLLQVSGPDRKTFLQGLLTNDLHKLKPAHPLYSALLTPQGKFLHDLFIIEKGEALYLEGERERLPDLLKRLTLFKLRAKVELTLLTDLSILVSHKENTSPLDRSLDNSFTAFQDPRPCLSWYRAFGPTGKVPQALNPFETYNQKRLLLGIPEGSWDMTPEKAIPLECGLDDLGAIDWSKGCYMGQELTARTKHRGLVRKRFLPFTSSTPLSEMAGEILLQEDKNVGKVLSVEGKHGLARLRLEALNLSSEATLPKLPKPPITLKGLPVDIKIPSWMSLPDVGGSS